LLNYTFRKLKKVEVEKSREFQREFENSGIPWNSREFPTRNSRWPWAQRHIARIGLPVQEQNMWRW